VKDIRPGTEGSNPNSLVAAEDHLYFVADDGVSGREVWISDGTVSGKRGASVRGGESRGRMRG
jgi:hypothetical protein